MGSRVAALVFVIGLLGTGAPALAQPIEPPPLRDTTPAPASMREHPAAYLLPPVAPRGNTSSSTPDAPSSSAAQTTTPPAPQPLSGSPAPQPLSGSPSPQPQSSSTSSPPVDDRANLPPPAARFAVPKDLPTVPAAVVENQNRIQPAGAQKPLEGDDLFDYLSDGRRRKRTSDSDADSKDKDKDKDGHSSHKFGDRIRDMFDFDTDKKSGHGWFCSDHAFDTFVSPVTNPFLFEDPRALTEIRPIFIYQKVPSAQPNFQGGNIWFVGAQTRVAFGDRFSLTINKLGVTGVDAGSGSPYGDHTGLAELWLGPKVTVIRDEASNTLLAVGGIFQIPIGSSNVYQNTGTLTMTPYVSGGQKFLKDNAFGSINTLASTGYSFSTDRSRSDYFYVSGHVDFDVMNTHRFYPLAEMNWYQYTTNGTANLIAGEGRDLVNFGSSAKGSGLVTWALGGRIKLTKNVELGGAYEMPLFENRDFFRYRFTTDLIWRY
ncbi:hypothetical protein [Fimbriiglobus ruber]|uniref:Uncharacterized protein n=1 Tax=Fimbriiglobus ruber TaxID=1908690 RepID=A0A225D3T6_9BACT|nr:hypothetical protein [Fimbriiglobus ruber]OWK36261.1 hypothetical protein FRUB_08824 [Fimbriiglobus ruber]